MPINYVYIYTCNVYYILYTYVMYIILYTYIYIYTQDIDHRRWTADVKCLEQHCKQWASPDEVVDICWLLPELSQFRSARSAKRTHSAQTSTHVSKHLMAWRKLITPRIQRRNRTLAKKLLPQATARPSLRRSTVCAAPAASWVYLTPRFKGGMSHRPKRWHPQATARPSLRRSTVC